MPTSCVPESLANSASCLFCLSERQQLAVQTFLLSSVAGVAINPKNLTSSATPFTLLSFRHLLAIQAYLSCQIIGGTMICTPESLLNSASCFVCLSEKQLMAINSYLMCQILNGGAGGGVTGVSSGAGAPVNGTTLGTFYFDNVGDNLWANNNGTWIMLV